MVAVAVGLLLQGPLHRAECVRYILSVEDRFGFRSGWLAQVEHDTFAILDVSPGGLFARAGFRSGDVPVEHHDGLGAFRVALSESSAGHWSEVTVIHAAELADGWPRARVISIPALSSR